MDAEKVRRWAVPAIPFTLSLCLSGFTVGPHPYWQDSGLYLTAVKELGILYPPGFVLYEVLCFLWTRVLFCVDFTLAVHLFSSICAALAAGVISMATRDFLRSRGKIFGGLSEDSRLNVQGCAILAGVMMAGGYTFWSTAVYAKGYSFYYLMLSLLLWSLIRADERARPRDFTLVAALCGLSWQAHPSACLIGFALMLFVGFHFKSLGGKGVAGRVAVAAACALGPALLLLPLLVARDPWLTFGRPNTPLEFIRYAAGIRYLGEAGAFGVDKTRLMSFLRFTWEDLLGIGIVLTVIGVFEMWRRNSRAALWMACWVLPYAGITILFKTEGQHDCWFVAARMPLVLAVGAGALRLITIVGPLGRLSLGGAALAATVWSGVANGHDLAQRNYLLAEYYGRIVLETVDRDAIVVLSGDDANGLGSYEQRVRGERPDLILVTGSFLGSGEQTGNYWYEANLLGRHPDLIRPDYLDYAQNFPGVDKKQRATAAFINVNAAGSRAIFCEFSLPPELLRPEIVMIPAGVHWKVVSRRAIPAVDVSYWKFPIEPEAIRPLYRRARGQSVSRESKGIVVKTEPYERRLAALILTARFRLALAQVEAGQFALAARLCQSIIDYDDEEFENNPEIVHLLGISYYASGQYGRAEPVLKRSAEISIRKENRATSLFYRGDIAARGNRPEEARRYFEEAESLPGLDPAYLRKMAEWRKSR